MDLSLDVNSRHMDRNLVTFVYREEVHFVVVELKHQSVVAADK